MAPGSKHSDESLGVGGKPAKPGKPDWSDGLRQLYDSVVDEPLPDSFKDLLAQLDDDDPEAEDGGRKASGEAGKS